MNGIAAAGVNAFMNVSVTKKEPHALILAFACGPEKNVCLLLTGCYVPVGSAVFSSSGSGITEGFSVPIGSPPL